MSLASSLAAAEVGPIAGLSFDKLPTVSEYVTSKTEAYFVPSGNSFSSSGVRTLRISIAGNMFVDMSTVLMSMTVANNDTTNSLQPITSSCGSFFSELRILAGGIEVERIGSGACSYTRIEEALSRTLPMDKRINQAGN